MTDTHRGGEMMPEANDVQAVNCSVCGDRKTLCATCGRKDHRVNDPCEAHRKKMVQWRDCYACASGACTHEWRRDVGRSGWELQSFTCAKCGADRLRAAESLVKDLADALEDCRPIGPHEAVLARARAYLGSS